MGGGDVVCDGVRTCVVNRPAVRAPSPRLGIVFHTCSSLPLLLSLSTAVCQAHCSMRHTAATSPSLRQPHFATTKITTTTNSYNNTTFAQDGDRTEMRSPLWGGKNSYNIAPMFCGENLDLKLLSRDGEGEGGREGATSTYTTKPAPVCSPPCIPFGTSLQRHPFLRPIRPCSLVKRGDRPPATSPAPPRCLRRPPKVHGPPPPVPHLVPSVDVRHCRGAPSGMNAPREWTSHVEPNGRRGVFTPPPSLAPPLRCKALRLPREPLVRVLLKRLWWRGGRKTEKTEKRMERRRRTTDYTGRKRGAEGRVGCVVD